MNEFEYIDYDGEVKVVVKASRDKQKKCREGGGHAERTLNKPHKNGFKKFISVCCVCGCLMATTMKDR